jgi:putative transcriptional regulator
MSYSPISINHNSLTIMGVSFPDLMTLENTAQAIGSNMFEGFNPTSRSIEIIRDYCLGKISFAQLAVIAKQQYEV